MKKFRFARTGPLVLVVLLLLVPLGVAYAAQPGKPCQDTPTTPDHAVSAPGSAFNPNG